MGEKSRAFDALCTAITTDNGVEAAQRAYDAVVIGYKATDLDAEYGVIRAALEACPADGRLAAALVLWWCEDVNTRVLTGER